jgi:NAD(P)-dependent dehydrogenase (short-subunit alcohol dehydrogenase family)
MFNRFADELGDAASSLNDIIPHSKPAEPEQMVAAVHWLLSDASSYVTGQAISVDGSIA